MSHPLEEGDYLINAHSDLPMVRHVVALSNNRFVMVTPDHIQTPFPWKLWRLKRSDTGYTIWNVGAREYAHPQSPSDGSPVYLNGEESTVFNIQPDGKGLWRVVVPDRNLEWTEVDFPQDTKQGYIQLCGSVGSNKQRFTFQRFIGP